MKKYFRKNKQAAFIYLGLVIIALLGIVGYMYYKKSVTDIATNTNNQSIVTSTDSGVVQQDKAPAATSGVDTSKNTAEIPVSKDTTLEITKLEQNTQGVTYAASITNPGATGTCSAVFTNTGAKPVTQVNAVTGVTCGPYVVPSASFDMIGSWLLTLRYYNDSTQAVATQTIEVE